MAIGRRARNTLARIEAWRQYLTLRLSRPEIFAARPKPGHLRGIDFYPDTISLLRAVTESFSSFRQRHGYFPSLSRPQTFNEKITWQKFFTELPVPESGNKLLTGRFIPEGLQGVTAVPIVYQSDRPVLPSNEEIAEGWYFLKCNTGSDMCCRIRFPLAEEERARLEALCEEWLKADVGRSGEWWYAAFPRGILLEPSLSGGDYALSWNLYMMQGDLAYIQLVEKGPSGIKGLRLDADHKPIPAQYQQAEREPPAAFDDYGMKDEMIRIAKEIARPFDLVRVDLYVLPDHRIFLGEVTFSPSNALRIYHPDFDLQLGSMLDRIG